MRTLSQPTTRNPESRRARALRVLYVEDSADDAKLSIRQLEQAGFSPTTDIVDSPEPFAEALRATSYDVVLADNNIPGWSGTEALEMLQHHGWDVPFILVTGSLGEEPAVEFIKKGATDYVLKDRLARLPFAVERALKEKSVRDERRRAQALLNLRTQALEAAANAVFIADYNGRIIWVNEAFTVLTGYSRQEALGMDLRMRTLESGKQDLTVNEDLWTTILAGRVWHGEIINRRKDGTLYTEEMMIAPVRDSSSAITNFIAIKQDVTERKQAEQALSASETRYRRLFEAAHDGILLLDPDTGAIRDVNPFLLKFLEYTAEEVLGSKLWDIGALPDVLRSQHAFRTLQKEGFVRYEDLPLVTKSGGRREVEFVSNVYEAGGEKVIQCNIRDITERKRAEEALRDSEARHRLLFEAAQNGIVVLDPDTKRVTDANPAALEMLDSTREEVIGHRLWEIAAFERAGATMETFANWRSAELTVQQSSGLLMDVEFLTNTYRADNREVVQCSLRDVTFRRRAELETKALTQLLAEQVAERTAELEAMNLSLGVEIEDRKRAEEALGRLQRETELILNSAGEAIFRLGLDGECTFANPAAAELLGYDRQEIIGQELHGLIRHALPDDSPCPLESCSVHTVLTEGVVRRAEDHTIHRKNGVAVPVDSVATPIVERGGIVGAVVVFRDVSQRHAIEKMKDEFVSTVSHELRTPLTSIRGALWLLASDKSVKLSPRISRMMDIALRNAERLARLLNDILDCARWESAPAPIMRQGCKGPELVEQAAELMRPMADKAGVILETAVEPCTLSVDPDAILQTLGNLLSNAIKFSPPGSTVRLECGPEGAYTAFTAFRVIDHGPGIPSDHLESIFGRFQPVDASDTRRKGGTGLGLYLCRIIVERHGGRVWAESKLGEGSTFIVRLPIEQPCR
ncbi:MAG TPA: PAS domain S-box protein [Terriglobia bacterium]|nr:PAS domain S-box protein [Terriglobia bacterium]